MGQLDILVQTAPTDPGIPTLAVWSLHARCSHMTRSRENGVCVYEDSGTCQEQKQQQCTVHTYVGIFKSTASLYASKYFKSISSTSNRIYRLSGSVKHAPKPRGGNITSKRKDTLANPEPDESRE